MKWVLVVMLFELSYSNGQRISNEVEFQEWDDAKACLSAKSDMEKVLKDYPEKFDRQVLFCKPKGTL